MEVFFFEKDYYNLRYNCTFYDVDQIPLEKRRHRFLGSVILATYFLCMVCFLSFLHGLIIKTKFLVLLLSLPFHNDLNEQSRSGFL